MNERLMVMVTGVPGMAVSQNTTAVAALASVPFSSTEMKDLWITSWIEREVSPLMPEKNGIWESLGLMGRLWLFSPERVLR